VAVTPDGGFLFADSFNNRVRRVSPAGTITTVAGNGTAGAGGDGGPGTAAELNGPEGVAVTADGGLLIADTFNHRVRFVDADLRGPASGPVGPAGPQGPAGAAGATGPQGPAGAPGRAFDRLALALATDSLRARPRQRVTLRYAITTAAAVELRVLSARHRVAGATVIARVGRNTIRVFHKLSTYPASRLGPATPWLRPAAGLCSAPVTAPPLARAEARRQSGRPPWHVISGLFAERSPCEARPTRPGTRALPRRLIV
jgi:hypothetical protein